MVVILEENWKDYRLSEAKSQFSIDDIVQYTHGYTRFDENNFAQIHKISPSGIVYGTKVDLESVNRNKLKHPSDVQLGGWFDYDPKQFTLDTSDESEVKFMPRLSYTSHFDKNQEEWIYTHFIKWDAAKGTGMYSLRPLKLDEKGLVRASYASVM